MKNLRMAIAALSLASLAACNNTPKADEAKTEAPQPVQETKSANTYRVDAQKSKIGWIGSKPTGRHHGEFMLSDGSITVNNDNAINAGSFTIDMNSTTAFDEDGSALPKLQTDLKSPNFFEVEKFPVAKFEITSVQQGVTDNKDLVMKDATHMVTGNLVLKEVSKSVTFPAKISIADKKLTADANFNIDRTNWGINYKSDKSLGNKVINNEVNIQLHIEAAE